jgi:hypothetical protein
MMLPANGQLVRAEARIGGSPWRHQCEPDAWALALTMSSNPKTRAMSAMLCFIVEHFQECHVMAAVARLLGKIPALTGAWTSPAR